ncbi:E3 ubiquitin-protein ligase ATL4-like [Vicia villosa]|uniref:E3 ubiquitin-protein ligase ATL4-like n=1 Tax=Vicia villosa TaxID=3911 RepID=UPI00273C1DC1|nr:E3 ubiquitin-protein ligase ATL4-like [Vicia villosa]
MDTVTPPSVTPPSLHRSSPLQNISPSILIIVTILAITVIVSVAIFFLLRHLNCNRLRRVASDRYPTTYTVSHPSHWISPELRPSVIDALPLFPYSSVSRRSSTVTAADCAVCLSKFRNSDLLRSLPLCLHAFHAECIDTWLSSNLSCPLCRSSIFTSDSDLNKILRSTSSDSFPIEIGNISRRRPESVSVSVIEIDTNAESVGDGRSYSIGSFEYYVEEPSEVLFTQDHRRSISDQKDIHIPVLPANPPISHETLETVTGNTGSGYWLKEYMDRLSASISSRTASFRSSGRFFGGGGSSRRIEPVDYDVEGNRIGEEITEMFSWLSSGV